MTTLELLQSLAPTEPKEGERRVDAATAMAALKLRFAGGKREKPEVHFDAPAPTPQLTECDRSDRPDWALLPVPQRVTPLELTKRVRDGMPVEVAIPFFTTPSQEK